MDKHVLFIQGAGDVGYQGDLELVASLRIALGTDYKVHYPEMPTDEVPFFGAGWPKQIGEEISFVKGEVILAGHSLGASMLLKFLTENPVPKNIQGVFLLATPFWSGTEDWKQCLKLNKKFEENLPTDIPIFLYHAKDDEEVPFSHFNRYKKKIPKAIFRESKTGGHQFNNHLSLIIDDILSL